MTAPPLGPPQGPPQGPPLAPERLAELLDGAVRQVTAPADAFDRIRRGVRRRRTARRAGALLLAVAVLAGGGATALVLTSARGPSGLASSAVAQGGPRYNAATTVSSVAAHKALSSGRGPAPAPGRVSAPAPLAAPAAAPSAASSGWPGWDIDGDGRPDLAAIVPVGNASTTVSFQLVVHTTQLGVQAVPFTATSAAGMPPHGPVIVGAAQAAKDGRAELFVMVGAGCCTEFWTIFRVVDGRIRQVSMSGQPLRLAVGGSVTDNGGFSCNGPDLVTYGYRPGTAAGTFLAVRETYRWAGATLVLIARQQTTIHGTPPDPELATYTGVACGDLPQYESVR